MNGGNPNKAMVFYTQAGLAKKVGENVEVDENSPKRRKVDEKFKFSPPMSQKNEEKEPSVKRSAYAPKILQNPPIPSTVKNVGENEEIDYIDAYFASLPKPASSYLEKRPTVKPTFVTKTSLAGDF